VSQPNTLVEAIRYFSDKQTCINAVAAMRWEDGSPVCPKCNAAQGERNHYWLQTQKRWKCYACRKQFSVKVGTIFEDSPLDLHIWLTAMWMLCNCKNGVSSYEIGRATGIAQKSAWFVLQRLRHVLKDIQPMKLDGGPIEIDECHVGPKPKNMHKDKRLARKVGMDGYADKTAIMGMLDRTSRQVRATVIPNASRETLQKQILERVGFGSTVYTDGWQGYIGLAAKQYVHETVNHLEEYVRGNVHTQGIENFWSCLKRTLTGTYIAVEPFHMDGYLAEQCFRFNNRKDMNDGDRFTKALAGVGGKRLTWVELTGKEAGTRN
jgi:transposase-like protein